VAINVQWQYNLGGGHICWTNAKFLKFLSSKGSISPKIANSHTLKQCDFFTEISYLSSLRNFTKLMLNRPAYMTASQVCLPNGDLSFTSYCFKSLQCSAFQSIFQFVKASKNECLFHPEKILKSWLGSQSS
jgi:hypothetical protein